MQQCKVKSCWCYASRRHCLGVRLLERLRPIFDARNELVGWKIRSIEGGHWRCHLLEDKMRPRLINTTFELRDAMVRTSQEEIEFGSALGPDSRTRIIGASRGLFEMIIGTVDDVNGQAMLYDATTKSYVYCEDMRKLSEMDPPFAAYFDKPTPDRKPRGNILVPELLTDVECVECLIDGAVFRTELSPPSAAYATAKDFFRSNPEQSLMNAEKYQELFHIGGMEAHFD